MSYEKSVGFIIGIGCATVISIAIAKSSGNSEIQSLHRWHPPIDARVTFKEQHRRREGTDTLVIGFVAWGGYHGRVQVDSSAFERARHWSCIRVRFNEEAMKHSQWPWYFVGVSDGCEGIR